MTRVIRRLKELLAALLELAREFEQFVLTVFAMAALIYLVTHWGK